MAVDLSKNVFELFSGKKRIRVRPTLLIAIFMTAIVAIPFTIRVVDARNAPPEPELLAPVDAQAIVVDTANSEPMPLDASTVSGPILISVREPGATVASFRLFAAGADEPVLATQDLEGPQFDLMLRENGGGEPLDSTLLLNGEYDLFVSLTSNGEEKRTAVRFAVDNP